MVCVNGNTMCNLRDRCTACRALPAIRPLVHLNGSSAERLADDLMRAASALTDALKALADAAPNARDYYPLGDDAWRAARDLHETHMRQLRDMRTTYTVAYEHVIEQREARHGSR